MEVIWYLMAKMRYFILPLKIICKKKSEALLKICDLINWGVFLTHSTSKLSILNNNWVNQQWLTQWLTIIIVLIVITDSDHFGLKSLSPRLYVFVWIIHTRTGLSMASMYWNLEGLNFYCQIYGWLKKRSFISKYLMGQLSCYNFTKSSPDSSYKHFMKSSISNIISGIDLFHGHFNEADYLNIKKFSRLQFKLK